jgi:D-alanine-D-alanine ligase
VSKNVLKNVSKKSDKKGAEEGVELTMEPKHFSWSQEKKNAVIGQCGRVAVFLGGDSAEREVSLKSGHAVLTALQEQGVEAFAFDARRENLKRLSAESFDRVFLALHGRGGEDGTVQGYLDVLGVPYTGSGVLASSLAMDKIRTKQLWLGKGLRTPEFVELNKGTDWQQTMQLLGATVCVKPAHEGSSIGVRKVTTAAELEEAFYQAASIDGLVLAERWITGPEFTVGILNDRVLPVIGLSTSNIFYDYEAKYVSNETRYLLPSGLDADKDAEIQALSLQAFNAVGCKTWGRVDVMADTDGEFWLLEVNTIPGMTDHSLVPMAARYAGIEFGDLVLRILAETLDGQALLEG